MTNPNDPQQPGQWGPQQNWGSGGQPPQQQPPQYGPPQQQPPQYGSPQQQPPQYGPPQGQGQYGPPAQGQYPSQQGQYGPPQQVQYPPQQGQFGPQQGYGQPYGPPPKKNNKAVIWSIIIVIVLVGGGLGLYFGLKGDDSKGGNQASCSDAVASLKNAVKNEPHPDVKLDGNGDVPGSLPKLSSDAVCDVRIGEHLQQATLVTSTSTSQSDYATQLTKAGFKKVGNEQLNGTSADEYLGSDMQSGLLLLTVDKQLVIVYSNQAESSSQGSDSGGSNSGASPGSGGGAGGGVGPSSAPPS